MSDRLEGRKARTEKLVDYFRGNADEFAMLKGVLCVSHVMEDQDSTRWRYFFDTLRIAERMDEIKEGRNG
ncbi:hypothetical protein ACQKRQ_34335 [Paraburkholderia sp. NPDC080076]|uniref:hypothetical protein n=1 Tax=Paraburkholderia sp. NPDC080076 TaxID=3390605 RepID=UPI003D00D55C